jgi:aspartyl protease family protein
MMKVAPFVVVTIAIGGAVGMMAPGDSTPAVVAPAGIQPAAEAQLKTVQQEDWVGGEVVLQRAGDGHFYANVAVNGSPALMLVDTGATTLALTGDDAEAMGVMWNESEVRPVARGASGDVYGVPVMLDHVQLGDLEASGVAAIVVPEGLGISLLGQSFLSRIEKVEMEQDRMVLGS